MKKAMTLICGVLIFLGTSLAQTSNSLTFTVNNPAPTLTTIAPASAIAGTATQTLTLTGSNFVTTTTATFNGVGHAFTFVSPTQGTILLTTTDQAVAGTYQVCTTNPAPGGGASGCLSFQVNQALSATSLAPTSCTVYNTCGGAVALTLTVNGTGFVSGSTVNWNGTAMVTTFVSASQVKATIPASAVAGAGTVTVTVSNPTGTPVAHVVGLTWTASPTVGIVGYNVFRSTIPDPTFNMISGVGVTSTNMNDAGVVNGKTYQYFVTAYTADGSQSSGSNIATAVIP